MKVFLIVVGWTLGLFVSGVYTAISFIAYQLPVFTLIKILVTAGMLSGAIGGLFIGLALRQGERAISWRQVLLITLGWAIGLSIGLSILAAISNLLGYWIGFTMGGAIGGLVTGLVLCWRQRAISWRQVLLITLGWAIGFALGSAVTWVTNLYVIGGLMPRLLVGAPVFGVIAGTIGGGVMLWQINQSDA
jgi:hypothetical protein